MKESIQGHLYAMVFLFLWWYDECTNTELRSTLKEERVDRCVKEWKMPKQWCLGQAQIDKW